MASVRLYQRGKGGWERGCAGNGEKESGKSEGGMKKGAGIFMRKAVVQHCM